MTEDEWLVAEFFPPTLSYIRTRISTRKFLLLAPALCRRVWEKMPCDDCRRAVETVERLADHPRVDSDDYSVAAESDALFDRLRKDFVQANEADLGPRGAYLAAIGCATMWHDPDGTIDMLADAAAISAAEANEGSVWEAERQAQARLLHELFGNPFRPVTFAPAWRSETAVALASGIYADRAFDRLPILADALEEAGCDHPDVLAHLRGPGPHARGCWPLDLVLGKS